MNPTAAIVTVIAAEVCTLLGMWLRLRCRRQREHARRPYLVGITECIRNGGRLDIYEHDPDGRRLRVTLTCPAPRPQSELSSV